MASIDTMSGPTALSDGTGLKQSAHYQIPLSRAGAWSFTSYFNASPGAEHPALSGMVTTDQVATYFRGTTLLNPAASMNSVQTDYDPTRDAAGNISLKVDLVGDKYGMEWGLMVTAGLRTDTTATIGAFVDDNGAGTTFGAQAYWQLVAFTGTSVTIDINHCTTSGGSYTNLMNSGAQTGIGAGRMSVANTTTVNRYLEITTVGTFTLATFAVQFCRNKIAGQVF